MIRVVRVIEYTYPDVDTMERDMRDWTTRLRENQAKRGMEMRSTHFLPEFKDDES